MDSLLAVVSGSVFVLIWFGFGLFDGGRFGFKAYGAVVVCGWLV